jgi:hypothetical protein
MFRLLVACALTALLLLSGKSLAQTAEGDTVKVGDRWSYDVKDDATGDLRQAITVVVTDINDSEITTRVTVRGKDHVNTVVYARDWGRIDDGRWRNRPAGIGIQTPLQVGKEWHSDTNGQSLENSTVMHSTGVAKVAAQESVTTPAGTFDTFRVEANIRQINGADQTKSSTVQETSWYAPAVHRSVRRKTEIKFEGRVRESRIEELTDYSRKP